MKRNVILAITILTIAAMQLAGCRPNWQEYTFEEENFIVEFPYEADVDNSVERIGSLKIYNRSYEASPPYFFGGISYSVNVISYKDDRDKNYDKRLDLFLGDLRVGISRQPGAKLTPNFPFDADYYGGTEFQVNYKKSVSTIRVTKNGLKIYGLEVAVPDGENVSGEIDRFFASFRFIESMD